MRGQFTSHEYGDDGASGARGVKWNAIGLAGRQAILLGFSLLLARIIGPASYGLIAQAIILSSFMTLLLDQGLTAALVSRKSISSQQASAASSVNLLLGAGLGMAMVLFADAYAAFFRAPELSAVVIVLGVALILKALAIVPRMLLTRRLNFRAVAIADVAGALVGGIGATAFAVTGGSYWSLVLQIVAADAVVCALLLIFGRPPLPSMQLRVIRDDMSFGLRVFAGNIVSFGSRNADNLIVGRVFGAEALAFYSLAYRVLLTPVQMVGQVVTRVLFPLIARSREDLSMIRALVTRSTVSIAVLTFPVMALIAVVAPDIVPLVLGDEWMPAVPVLQILALTGARQSVTAVNAPILLGLGRADVHLRFNIAAAVVQVAGMVLGIPWGILGVSVGYTVAGLALTPIIFLIQKRLIGLSCRGQLMALMPPAVCAILAILPYLLLIQVLPYEGPRLAIGALLAVAIYLSVLRLAFVATWRSVWEEFARLIGRDG